jgi:two-component system, NarL family, invasion response regulator UvrY
MSKPVSIFLVDDHAVVRNGLKALIERMGNYVIKEQFDNGQQLIDSLPFAQAPDIIIMDLTMPVMDGTQTVRELKHRHITTPVLILTLETTEKTIIELFRLGIRGYLPKSCTADVLKKAIDDVITSGYYHNEMLTKALMNNNQEPENDNPLQHLTERENTFLQLVCDENELTYEQIADRMGVSRRTVDGYRESIFEKFNIKSKTGLVLFAIKYGLIKVEA